MTLYYILDILVALWFIFELWFVIWIIWLKNQFFWLFQVMFNCIFPVCSRRKNKEDIINLTNKMRIWCKILININLRFFKVFETFQAFNIIPFFLFIFFLNTDASCFVEFKILSKFVFFISHTEIKKGKLAQFTEI